MAAFLSNVPSALLAISSFGVFSAVLIFVNYCSVIIFFPSVVLMHKTHRQGKFCCCLFTKWTSNLPENGENKRKRLASYIIRFFEKTFFDKVVEHRIMRFVVLTLFLVRIVVSIVFAARLKPDEEQVKSLLVSSYKF